MLALGRALWRARNLPALDSSVELLTVWSISVFLNEKVDSRTLILARKNILIKVAKNGDPSVVKVKKIEQWHRPKVHGMPLERYLGDRQIELLVEKLSRTLD